MFGELGGAYPSCDIAGGVTSRVVSCRAHPSEKALGGGRAASVLRRMFGSYFYGWTEKEEPGVAICCSHCGGHFCARRNRRLPYMRIAVWGEEWGGRGALRRDDGSILFAGCLPRQNDTSARVLVTT